MKNVLKIGFVAGLTFFSTLAFGKDNDYIVSLQNATASTVKVEVAKAKNVSLSIYNETEDEIYAENIGNEDNFMKSYNFKNLPSGIYYLVAESDAKLEKYEIRIKKGKVVIENEPVEAIEKPEYKVEGNHVKVHMDDLNENVKISVTDSEDYEYYNALKTPNNGKLSIDFDFNPENSDTYMIRIEKNEGGLKKAFSVK